MLDVQVSRANRLCNCTIKDLQPGESGVASAPDAPRGL